MKILKSHCLFIFLFPLLIGVSLSCAGGDIQSSIKGTWKSACMDLGSGVYIITTTTYDGAGHSSDKTVFYSDSGCSKPTGMVKANTSSNYVIGQKVTAGDGQEAYEIDITIKAWQLTQNGSVLRSGGAMPTMYDIIAIKGNKLYSSGLSRAQKGPITNPAQRPTTLDMKNYFKRQ
jgi:hypothetical protein